MRREFTIFQLMTKAPDVTLFVILAVASRVLCLIKTSRAPDPFDQVLARPVRSIQLSAAAYRRVRPNLPLPTLLFLGPCSLIPDPQSLIPASCFLPPASCPLLPISHPHHPLRITHYAFCITHYAMLCIAHSELRIV